MCNPSAANATTVARSTTTPACGPPEPPAAPLSAPLGLAPSAGPEEGDDRGGRHQGHCAVAGDGPAVLSSILVERGLGPRQVVLIFEQAPKNPGHEGLVVGRVRTRGGDITAAK